MTVGIVLLALSALGSKLLAVELDSAVYTEVDPRFETNFETRCYLESQVYPPMKISKLYYCSLLCSAITDCTLFCLIHQSAECRFYRAFVGPHYQGNQWGDPIPAMTCYSSWWHPRDVAMYATVTATPRIAEFNAQKDMAVNGYICYSEPGSIYCSQSSLYPWWAADLGGRRTVTSVRVLTRTFTNHPTYFRKIEVRVGDTNYGNGDFSNNALLEYYEGPAAHRKHITFSANAPLEGSVVSIQTIYNGNNYLILPDVQIIVE